MENRSIEEIEKLRVKAAGIIKTGSIISVSLSVLIALWNSVCICITYNWTCNNYDSK